jgi:hypothetical protein
VLLSADESTYIGTVIILNLTVNLTVKFDLSVQTRALVQLTKEHPIQQVRASYGINIWHRV